MHEFPNKPWSAWKICHKVYKHEKTASIQIDACINQFRHRLCKVVEVAGKTHLNIFSRIAVLGEMCDC